MERAGRELGKAGHDPSVFSVEPQSFFVGKNPNSALSFIAQAKRNNQTFNNRSADIIEIVKVAARE
jgi:hypothetical protein